MKTVFEIELSGWPIKLQQTSKGKFAVLYGSDGKRRLDYRTAAHELGYCILHALACEGKLDTDE